jgi:hypothetical protein
MLSPYRIRSPGVFRAAGQAIEDPAVRQYLDRLMRLIPAEIVAIYPPIAATIPKESHAIVIWPVIAFTLLIVQRAVFSRDPDRRLGPQWGAIVIAAGSFLIWLYTLDGVLVERIFGAYYPYWGLIFSVSWTFIVPAFYRGDSIGSTPSPAPSSGLTRPPAETDASSPRPESPSDRK